MAETEIDGINVPADVTDDVVAKPVVDLLKEKYKAGKDSLTLDDVHEVLKFGLERLLALQSDKEHEVSRNVTQKDPTNVYLQWKKRVSIIAKKVVSLNAAYEEEKKWNEKLFLVSGEQLRSLSELYLLCKNIKSALSDVIRLLGDECPKEILIDKRADIVIKEIEEYPTLQKAFQDIKALLQDNGGKHVAFVGRVGKATIVHHLNNHFRGSDDFDEVIFINEAALDDYDEGEGEGEGVGVVCGKWEKLGRRHWRQWEGGYYKRAILHILKKITDQVKVNREGNGSEVTGRILEVLENKRCLLILDGLRITLLFIEIVDMWKNKAGSKVVMTADDRYSEFLLGYVNRKVYLQRLSRTEAWKMFRHIVGQYHLPPTAKPASLLEGASSSKSSPIAIGKPQLLQDVSRLMGIQEFLHLMLSYPVIIGYEEILQQWIDDVDDLLILADGADLADLRRRAEHLLSESPLRYVQALIPKDITEEIINGGSISKEQVPQPIPLLATHFALHQLTLVLTSSSISNSRWEPKIENIWLSTRSDEEKRTVVTNIHANSGIRDKFKYFRIVDLNQTDDENLTKWPEQTSSADWPPENYGWGRHLVLVVDGDGDRKADFSSVSLPFKGSKSVVFITTLSPNDELSQKVDLTIKTEHHLLPWELFCSIVGSELLHSSSAIKEIAVKIVEKCGGHLLAIILMAKSLKQVTDVQHWELALPKLNYHNRETIVNAFSNIIWQNVTSEREKIRLIRCLMPLIFVKFQDYCMMSDERLFASWFSQQLVDSEQEAKSILQNLIECSVLLQFEGPAGQCIVLPKDIKIIIHALGEEILENLSDEGSAPTISDHQVLTLSNTHMKRLYDGAVRPDLEILDLKGIMLKTPPKAIFKIQKLKTLSLEDCSQLQELPPQIAKLENLKELRLTGCERLETLPQEIWELPNLETLSLPGTAIFPSSENQELIISEDLPPSSSIYHEHSGPGKQAIPSSSSAIVLKAFKLKLKAHGGFKQFQQLHQKIMQCTIQNIEKCDLSGTHITELPPCLNFPNLRNLSLGNNLNLMKIPSSFFDHVPQLSILDLSHTSIHKLPSSFCDHVPQLSILDLSHTSIHELPSSIFNLKELRELYLKDCELFVELPSEIGRLKELVILDLDGTLITHLPREIGSLSKLESLSLSFYNDSNSKIIPHDVLYRFNDCLKVLRITINSDNEWWLNNFEIYLLQISGLKKLEVLDIYIPRVRFRPQIKKSQLSNFRFIMGYHKPRVISRVPPSIEVMFKESSRSLKFINGEGFPENVKSILSEARAFFLDRHMKINNLTQFGLKNLKQLRFCILGECHEMQSIVDMDKYEADSDLDESFCMQFLTIYYMKILRSIINKPILSNNMFCELKLLALHTCPQLTTIFTMDSLYSLVHLEELIVEDCPKVSSMISCSSVERKTDFFLPKLRKLSLLFVPELVSISNGVCIGRNLEKVGLYYCPKLQSLSTAELSSENLKVIRGEMEWWEKLHWSEKEWGQQDPPHKFSQIFSPFDEDLDILTQFSPYELMTSLNI